MEPLCAAGKNVKIAPPVWKSLVVLQKVQQRIASATEWLNSVSTYTPKKWKQVLKYLYTNIHSSSIHNSQANLMSINIMNGSTNQGISIQRNIIWLYKGSTDLCYKMINPEIILLSQRSQTQKAIYCMIPFLWNAWTESRLVVRGLGGGENGEWLIIGTGLLFGMMKTSWN